jgi:hypothetical protein
MDPVYISNGAYSILIDDFKAWSGNYFLSREVHYLMLCSPGSRATSYLFIYDVKKLIQLKKFKNKNQI